MSTGYMQGRIGFVEGYKYARTICRPYDYHTLAKASIVKWFGPP